MIGDSQKKLTRSYGTESNAEPQRPGHDGTVLGLSVLTWREVVAAAVARWYCPRWDARSGGSTGGWHRYRRGTSQVVVHVTVAPFWSRTSISRQYIRPLPLSV